MKFDLNMDIEKFRRFGRIYKFVFVGKDVGIEIG